MAPRKIGMDRANELLSKVPEYRGALGTYTPLTKPMLTIVLLRGSVLP